MRRWPDDGQVWQVSAGGGTNPLWARDGRSLYYVAGQRMMSVSFDSTDGVTVGEAREILDGQFSTARGRDFDVDASGRFVSVQRVGGTDDRKIRMLLNWPARVEQLMGDAK